MHNHVRCHIAMYPFLITLQNGAKNASWSCNNSLPKILFVFILKVRKIKVSLAYFSNVVFICGEILNTNSSCNFPFPIKQYACNDWQNKFLPRFLCIKSWHSKYTNISDTQVAFLNISIFLHSLTWVDIFLLCSR